SLKEGRKALILVSEGYSNLPPPQMRNADATMPGLANPNARNPSAGDNDLNEDRAQWAASVDMESDLREVYDNANRKNVEIYAGDPRDGPPRGTWNPISGSATTTPIATTWRSTPSTRAACPASSSTSTKTSAF